MGVPCSSGNVNSGALSPSLTTGTPLILERRLQGLLCLLSLPGRLRTKLHTLRRGRPCRHWRHGRRIHTKSFLPAWRTLLAGMFTPNEIALVFDLDNTLLMSNIDFGAVRQKLIDMLQAAGA